MTKPCPASTGTIISVEQLRETFYRIEREASRTVAYHSVYLKSAYWRSLRKKILMRDTHRCQMCGDTKRLQVHHKTYANLFAERDADLITLCEGCHNATHRSGNIAVPVRKSTNGKKTERHDTQKTSSTNTVYQKSTWTRERLEECTTRPKGCPRALWNDIQFHKNKPVKPTAPKKKKKTKKKTKMNATPSMVPKKPLIPARPIRRVTTIPQFQQHTY